MAKMIYCQSILFVILFAIQDGNCQILGQTTATTNAGMDEDLKHECLRPCNQTTEPKKCHYNFIAEWYISMSKACYKCPFNATDCSRPHCAHADGYERPLVTINRRLPGPAIHVCEGDEIIVDLKNDLISDSTTLHWHGIHQRGTQYMDGVPFLTQCPIQPGTTFRYHFVADMRGTHYWHSHSSLQRTDGMFGALIIRPADDTHKDLYDFDDPKHVFVLTDWMDGLGIDKFVNHHHTEHDNKPYNLLVNGMGKYKPLIKHNLEAYTPVYEIVVKRGFRYRLRTIGNSIQNCPIQISVDNHTLLVISSDGHDIKPVEVHSLVIFGGERWDFVINANKRVGTYWIKFRGLLDCDERFKSAHQVAVLRYEGATGNPGRFEDINYDSTRREGLELNRLNAAPGDMVNFMTAADVRSEGIDYDFERLKEEPNNKFYLNFDFYGIDNELFHHKDFYPFFGVEKSLRLYMPQVNHITMKLPDAPPLSQPEDIDPSGICNETSRPHCKDEFCQCTYILTIPLGSLVEVILVDSGVVYWANHPFHMHGDEFAVLGMGRLGEETTLEAVKELDKSGKMERNFDNPPIKDTVTVPDGGYTVIRFIANNPGFWLFHCHIAYHHETGMAVVFQVGERSHIPPVPDNFPKCKSYLPPIQKDLKEFAKRWTYDRIYTKYSNIQNTSQTSPYSYSIQPKENVGVFLTPSLYLIILLCFSIMW